MRAAEIVTRIMPRETVKPRGTRIDRVFTAGLIGNALGVTSVTLILRPEPVRRLITEARRRSSDAVPQIKRLGYEGTEIIRRTSRGRARFSPPNDSRKEIGNS